MNTKIHSLSLKCHQNQWFISDANSNDDIIVAKPLKKFKARRPVIADISDDLIKDKAAAKNVCPEGNKDHLETKKQIESLRKQYGDGWLHSQGATMVHSVLGIENERVEKPISTEEMIQSFLEESISAALPKAVECSTSTPIHSPGNSNVNDSISSNVCIEVKKIDPHFVTRFKTTGKATQKAL